MQEVWVLGTGIDTFLLSLVLAGARPLTLIFTVPIFSRLGLQEGILRGAIVVAFTAPILPGTIDLLAALPVPPQGLALAGIIGKELLIGLLMGLLLGVPLWAVSAVGNLIDMQRGASMANLIDPNSGQEDTPTGTLLFLMCAFVLVMSGWFTEVLLATLYESYAAWPILAPLPPLRPEAAEGALAILSAISRTAITLALPVVGILLLTEFVLGLVFRYTPQINAMFLAMSVKQLIFALLMPVYFVLLVQYMRIEVADLGRTPERLDGFLAPDARP